MTWDRTPVHSSGASGASTTAWACWPRAGAGAVLAACSSPSTRSTTTTSGSRRRQAFPLGAAAEASSKPVAITLWHSMTSANLTTLTTLTNQFNSSQSDVHVNLVNQNSYTDTLTAYTTALSGGTLPDVVQMETTDLQFLIDSQSVVPAQSAVDAEHYDLSDFIPRRWSSSRSRGRCGPCRSTSRARSSTTTRTPSAPPGSIPPRRPRPSTTCAVAAEKIVSSETEKYGMSLKVTDSTFQLLSRPRGTGSGQPRQRSPGPGHRRLLRRRLGKVHLRLVGGMLDDKLAQATSGTTYDNLFAIGNRIAPMSFDTSAAIGTILGVLNTYPTGRSSGSQACYRSISARGGGVFVGGAGLYMVSKSPPERQDAAWQFIKFLTDPATTGHLGGRHRLHPHPQVGHTIPSLRHAWESQSRATGWPTSRSCRAPRTTPPPAPSSGPSPR